MAGLTVRIEGDTRGLDKALGKATGGIDLFGKQISGKAIAGLAGLAGVAGVAAFAIAQVTQAAAADADEQARLAQTIKVATGETTDYTAAVNAAITAGQARAFSDSETRAALEPLIRATGDMTAATSLLTVTQDIARAAQVDLATAADAVAKAQQGQDKALRALLPGLEAGATATDTLANAQAAAAGAADTFAASTEGQTKRVTDGFGELTEQLGTAFLPILAELLPALLPIIDALGELLSTVLPVLIPLIKLLAQTIGFLARMVAGVLDDIAELVRLFLNGIEVVRRFIDSINPLRGFSLPGWITGGQAAAFGLPAASAFGGGPAATSSGGAVPAAVTINIVGDPLTIEREVLHALRAISRRSALAIEGL